VDKLKQALIKSHHCQKKDYNTTSVSGLTLELGKKYLDNEMTIRGTKLIPKLYIEGTILP